MRATTVNEFRGAVPPVPRRDGGVPLQDMAEASAMTIPDTRPPSHNRPSRKPTGAGAPIVLALVAGAVIGFVVHQPTIGFLVGAAVGGAIALVLWMRDRRG